MCKGVAVMRRRADGWLNATQILKVAGFDKPQRTRILEREVQKGEHEKVQGGYGKYQGPRLPIARSTRRPLKRLRRDVDPHRARPRPRAPVRVRARPAADHRLPARGEEPAARAQAPPPAAQRRRQQ
jgi:transcription factor MBP1